MNQNFKKPMNLLVYLVTRLFKKQITLPLLGYILYLLKKDLFDVLKQEYDDTNYHATKKIVKSNTKRYKAKTLTGFDGIQRIDHKKEFDWSNTKGYPYQPFKPGEYNLNMNVKTVNVDSWLMIEDTYKRNIEKKWEIIKNKYYDVVFFLDKNYKRRYTKLSDIGLIVKEDDFVQMKTSVCKLYDHVVTYLLNRYPSVFEVVVADSSPTDSTTPGVLYNRILNEYHPLDPWVYVSQSGAHWSQFLRYYCFENKSIIPEVDELDTETLSYHILILSMARLMEEDYILLFPNSSKQFNDQYCFFGGVFAFAAGFNPVARYLKPLSLVHEPVPEYTTRLETPMNKFFHRFKPGKLVMRVNYSFQTHNRFFVPDANKGKETEVIQAKTSHELHGKLHYRSERQCVMKLSDNNNGENNSGDPSGGPAVFTIKTYLFDIVNDFFEMSCYNSPQCLGELRQAVLDMQENIGQYKRKPEWGSGLVDLIDQRLAGY